MSAAAPISLSASPSPYQAPSLWNNVTFTLPNGGLVQLPAVSGEGYVYITIEPAAKVKQKQASGSGTGQTSQQRAQKSETTVEAIEPAKVSIEVVWTDRIHAQQEQALFLLNPNGPNGGTPVDIRHPEADANAVSHVMIEKFGKKKRDGARYSMSIDALEWNPPPPPAPGDGAETPSQVGKWAPSYGGGKSVVAAGAPVGPASSYTDVGFSGPNAPKAKP